MEEQLLHFIWHRNLYNADNLRTTTGDIIEVLHPGTPNQDQGPDFLQSRVRIGQQLWAGHVEIHIRSSAWYLHMHEHDSHYNNVILHVVWEEDQPALTLDGYRIPCLELSGRVDHTLLDRYRRLMNNVEWVPCAAALHTIPELLRTAWLERLMAERLEEKSDHIVRMLERFQFDWEQVFYIMLARQLGAPANRAAMEELAIRIPLRLLLKHRDRPDQAEALLFGAAGMLGKEIQHPYVLQLKREFEFQSLKHHIRPMPALHWKFMRMRPAHFPSLRIAQLANIIIQSDGFVSLIESFTPARDWVRLFSVTPPDPFWDTHYHLKEEAPPASKRLGKKTSETLLINVVIPLMFVYGKHQGKPALKDFALTMMTKLEPEQNAIVSGWKTCGWAALDAGQSQALLYLRKQYCDQKRCLHCAIGLHVLK